MIDSWKFLALLLIAFVITDLTGCSNSNLSRSRAQKLIDQKIKDAKRRDDQHDIHVYISVGHVQYLFPGRYCDDPTFTPYEVKKANDDHLVSAGIVTMTRLSPCGDWQISLTPMASKDATAGSSLTTLKVGQFTDDVITGIVQDGPNATADLDTHFSLTPSGLGLAKAGYQIPAGQDCYPTPEKALLTCHEKVKFLRYDDGWRIADKQ